MKFEEEARTAILVADDHPLMRAGVALALAEFGMHVVAEANTPDEAVVQYGQYRPDVAILDIEFGTARDGIEAARDILAGNPEARIVFLSEFNQRRMIRDCYRAGGYAVVVKDCSAAQLAQAVHHARSGERYFTPAVAQYLANLMFDQERSPQALLQPREFDIFLLIAKGWTLVEIADKLSLSLKTISNESQTIKDKLGIHRIAELTLLAVKHELIAP